jgi:hypothetical protein
MSSITWTKAGSGYWNINGNWSGGKQPGSADSVTLTSAARETVYLSTADTIAALTSTNDQLAIEENDLTVTGNTTLAGGLSGNSALAPNGGTLTLLGAANTIAGGVDIGTGDLILGTGTALRMNGSAVFGAATSNYGAHIHGAGTLTTSGPVNIVEDGLTAELTMGGGFTWVNEGTVTMAAIVNAGYNAGIAFTIINHAGAVFDFTTDIACLMNAQMDNGQGTLVTASSDLVNNGLLEKTGNAGATTVYSTITSSGTIEVFMGTIDLEDGGSVAGLVEGAGTLQFSDGGNLHNALATIAQIDITGGDLILNAVTLSGTLTDAARIDQTGAVTLGSGTDTASLVIDDVYNIDNSSSIVLAGDGGGITIAAGGTFAKITGTGPSAINPAVVDDGSIFADAGKLRFAGALTGSGSATIANGASLETSGSVGGGIIVTLGTSSDLLIDQTGQFAGQIANFVAGDTLDIGGLKVTTATASASGTLSLFDSGATVGKLLLTNNDSGAVFTYGTDGHGGTLLEFSGAPDSAAAPRMGFIAAADLPATTGFDGLFSNAPQLTAPAAPQPAAATQAASWTQDRPSAGIVINLSGTHATALSLATHGHGWL